jgi:hypothetical protein
VARRHLLLRPLWPSRPDRSYIAPSDASRLLIEASGVDWIKRTDEGVNAPPVRKGHCRYRRTD